MKSRTLNIVKIVKSLESFPLFLGLFLLLGCDHGAVGLYPASISGETTVLWSDEWLGNVPAKPFPNDSFLNEAGYIDLPAGHDEYLAKALSEVRKFAPNSIISLPFTKSLAAGWQDWSGQKDDPIIILAAGPNNTLGQLISYKVTAHSTSDQLYLEPVRPLVPGEYAVVIKRGLDSYTTGSVSSPLPWINDPGQNEILRPLFDQKILDQSEVVFIWSFEVRELRGELKDIRAGLYGAGKLASLENLQLARIEVTLNDTLQSAAIPSFWDGKLDSLDVWPYIHGYQEKENLPLGQQLLAAPAFTVPYILAIPQHSKQKKVVITVTDQQGSVADYLDNMEELAASGTASIILPLDLPDITPAIPTAEVRQRWLQSSYDLLQMVRTVQHIDCHTNGRMDNNSDGLPDLLGDFDGDGQCDLSGVGTVTVVGDGIAKMLVHLVAGVEPLMVEGRPPSSAEMTAWLKLQKSKLTNPILERQLLDDFAALYFAED